MGGSDGGFMPPIVPAAAPVSKPKLLDRVCDAIRLRHSRQFRGSDLEVMAVRIVEIDRVGNFVVFELEFDAPPF